MANPVFSIIASFDQVPDIHITTGGDVNKGAFTGIPLIATVQHIKSEIDGNEGYIITFGISEMKKAVAAAIGTNVANVTVSFDSNTGELVFTAAGGGDVG